MANLPVTEISGIAGRREWRLSTWGIRTCLEMARADRRIIRQELTATGEALWWELNGISVLPINERRIPHKVLSRGGSFGEGSASPSVIYGWLVRNLERLIEELEYHETRTARVNAWVGYHDGREGKGKARLPAPSDRFDDLLDAFRPCLRQAWIPRAEAGRMHLFAEGLTPRVASQLGLFEGPAGRVERSARLAAVKREINAKVGRFMVRSGATLALPDEIYRDSAHGYDICDVRGKVCF